MTETTTRTATCPNCGTHFHFQSCQGAVPEEPPVGTWMKDRFGGVTQRQPSGWGAPGIEPFGRWEAMWAARGPYVECGPWGADL